jgi:hypothetical protein
MAVNRTVFVASAARHPSHTSRSCRVSIGSITIREKDVRLLLPRHHCARHENPVMGTVIFANMQRLMEAIDDPLLHSTVGEDNDGQIIIYTGRDHTSAPTLFKYES